MLALVHRRIAGASIPFSILRIDKTTFLNGFIKEELYMMQPEGFINPKGANKNCASSSDPFMDWCTPLGVGINVLIV